MKPDTSWCIKGGSRGYVTIREIKWPLGKKGSEHIETIPRGTEFESSVPKWLKWVLSPDNPFFLLAAVIHDWLLEHDYSQQFADSQWFDGARSEQAPEWLVWFAYIGMVFRRFGQWIFGKTELEMT